MFVHLTDLEFMSYSEDSTSTNHDGVSTIFWYNQSQGLQSRLEKSRLRPNSLRTNCNLMRERWLGWSSTGEIICQQNTYAALQHIYPQTLLFVKAYPLMAMFVRVCRKWPPFRSTPTLLTSTLCPVYSKNNIVSVKSATHWYLNIPTDALCQRQVDLPQLAGVMYGVCVRCWVTENTEFLSVLFFYVCMFWRLKWGLEDSASQITIYCGHSKSWAL